MAVAAIPSFRPSSSDRVPRDDRDEPHGLGDDELHLRHQALDLDGGHGGAETIARAEMRALAVAAQPVDLLRRHDPPVAAVASDPDRGLSGPTDAACRR